MTGKIGVKPHISLTILAIPPVTAMAPISAYVPLSAKVPRVLSNVCSRWPTSRPKAAPEVSDGTNIPAGTAVPYVTHAMIR